MPDPAQIQEMVERAVAEALDGRIADLRAAVVEHVVERFHAMLAAQADSAPPTALLEAAVSSVQDASGQGEILKAMIDGAANFAARSLLLVLRGGVLTSWQARGFKDNDAFRALTFDPNKGLAARAIQDRGPVAAAATEFDRGFVSKFGNPSDGNAMVLPLVVKDKVPALLYADGGTGATKIDTAALQLLVRATGQWLELQTLRKAGGTGDESGSVPVAAAAAAAATPVAAAPPPPRAVAAPAPGPAPAAPAISPADEEVHKKAKRFAKLLVDEIKLYNQAKVTEGRANKDLYNRLKDVIDKSRAAYDKRFGSGAAASAKYFDEEVVRILADNDVSLLGSGFPAS